jgi:tetratricopeptide (TPR) repeat protein
MEGDLVKARQMLEEYRRFAERMGATKEEGMEQYLEGWLLLHEGHSGEAVDLLRQAREIMNQAGRTYLLESVQVRMIDALLTQGDVEGARRELRSATYGGELMRMQEGWCCALESQTVRARRFLEQAVKEALSHRHLLTHGLALKHLARWEEGFGKRKRAQALFRKAQKQFDRSGVIPGSWYWEWPPSFVKKSATSLALRRPTVPTERRHGSPS